MGFVEEEVGNTEEITVQQQIIHIEEQEWDDAAASSSAESSDDEQEHSPLTSTVCGLNCQAPTTKEDADWTLIDHPEVAGREALERRWVRANIATHCALCMLDFAEASLSILFHKYHCMHCGNVICKACCQEVPMPEFQQRFKVVPLSAPTIAERALNRMTYVCRRCLKPRDWREVVLDFLLVPDLLAVAGSETSLKKLSQQRLLELRETLRVVDVKSIDSDVKQVLLKSSFAFAGHSRWMVLLLQLADFSLSEDTDSVLTAIKSHREHTCDVLMCRCSQRCAESLTFQQAAIALTAVAIGRAPDEVLDYVLWAADKKFEVGQAIHFLPLLGKAMESGTYPRLAIHKMMMKHCTWAVEAHESANKEGLPQLVVEYMAMLSVISDQGGNFERCLRDVMSFDKRESFMRMALVASLITDGDGTAPALATAVVGYKGEGYSSLVRADREVLKIDSVTALGTGSGAKPKLVTFTPRMGKVAWIVKREDMRKDKIIVNLIKWAEVTLLEGLKDRNQGANKFEKVVTFNVLPLHGGKGITEVVQNAVTLYNLEHPEIGKVQSISEYCIKNAGRISTSTHRNLRCSIAFYAVISYLLDLRDRHKGNLMVTTEGQLFHIDFGFVMGANPNIAKKAVENEVRMTDEMQRYYEPELIALYFNILRKRAHVFLAMLKLLVDYEPMMFTEEAITKHVESRFMLGVDDEEASRRLNSIIKRCGPNLLEYVGDHIHKAQQEGIPDKMLSALKDVMSTTASYLYHQ